MRCQHPQAGAGEPIDFLFFWGHQPRHNGDTGQRCLSEARGPGPFIADGVTYPTASIG